MEPQTVVDKFCYYPWVVYHDIKSAMHSSLVLQQAHLDQLASMHSDTRGILEDHNKPDLEVSCHSARDICM